jgi:hypothetical protein
LAEPESQAVFEPPSLAAPVLSSTKEEVEPAAIPALPSAPSTVIDSVPDEEDPRPPIRTPTAVALGLLAAALVAAAIPWTGILLVPLAALSLVSGVLATRSAFRADAGVRLPAITTAVAGLVVLLGVAVPGLLRPSYVSGNTPTLPADAIQVVPLPQYASSDVGTNWIHADKASIRQGRIRVEVAEAWLGPPPKAEKSVAKRTWLHVRVRLYRTRTGEEIAAGAFAPGLAWDRTHRATLRVGDGPAVEQLATIVRGRPGGSSAVGVTVDVTDEILAFDAPPTLEGLRLELPAAAWGGKGAFRFALPALFVRPPQGGPVSIGQPPDHRSRS